MTETDLNETNVTETDASGLSTSESEIEEPVGTEADLDEVHLDEPTASQLGSAGRNDRGRAVGVTALVLAFVVGLLIGYVARPFTDQLATGDRAEPVAQNEIVATNDPATENDSAVSESMDEQPTPSGNDESRAGDTGSEAPMLITPTPDRSHAIAALIEQNVRHFIGDEDAPVTLIEFSDFL